MRQIDAFFICTYLKYTIFIIITFIKIKDICTRTFYVIKLYRDDE